MKIQPRHAISLPTALVFAAACQSAVASELAASLQDRSRPVNVKLGECGPKLPRLAFVPWDLQEIRTMTGDQSLQLNSRLTVDQGPVQTTPAKIFVSGGKKSTTVQRYIDELNDMEQFMNQYGYSLRNEERDLVCDDGPAGSALLELNRGATKITGAHAPVVMAGRDPKDPQFQMVQGSICRIKPKPPGNVRDLNRRTNKKQPFASQVTNWPITTKNSVSSADIQSFLSGIDTDPRWPTREVKSGREAGAGTPAKKFPPLWASIANTGEPGAYGYGFATQPAQAASFKKFYDSDKLGVQSIAEVQFKLDVDGSATPNTSEFHANGQALYSRWGSPMKKALEADAKIVVNKGSQGTFTAVLKNANGNTIGSPVNRNTPIQDSGTITIANIPPENQVAIVMIGPIPVTINYSYKVDASVGWSAVAGTGTLPQGVPSTSPYLPIVAYAELTPKASVDATADVNVNLMLVRVGVETDLQVLWHESRFTGAVVLNYNSVKAPYLGLYADGLSDTRALCGKTGGTPSLVTGATTVPGGMGYLNGYLEYPKIKIIPPSVKWKRVTRKLFSWSGLKAQGYVLQHWDEIPL